MVVDDETDLLAIIGRILTGNGVKVHTFNDPELAIQHFKDDCTECNIVISDLRMPSMSGFELVMALKRLRPEVKIILMTAFRTNREEVQLILPNIQIDGFLNKPFRSRDLMQALADCKKS
jgi:DNA-binding NtrC family response regulator